MYNMKHLAILKTDLIKSHLSKNWQPNQAYLIGLDYKYY